MIQNVGVGCVLAVFLLGFGPALGEGGSVMSSDAPKVFLCGEDLNNWRAETGAWETVGGAAVDPDDETLLTGLPGQGVILNGPTGRTVDLLSKAEFGDVRAHLEFMVPKGSNSGVYFQGRYEIQVLDSWGVETPGYGDCGGIYQRWDETRDPMGYEGQAPRVNASRPPGEWQTFDVVFRAPRFDAAGQKIANACFVEVRHNGTLIHTNAEVTGPTRASRYAGEALRGPLMLQGDHGPVAYRNIWVIPMEERPFFAMDTGTRDAAHTTAESQVAMLAELGYSGIDHMGTEGIPELLRELDARGLRLFAIYTGIRIDSDDEPFDPGFEEALAALHGRGTVVWVHLESAAHASSDPAGDDDAVRVLRAAADLAADHGLRIALYPHLTSWVERVEDAVRVAKQVNRPNVGVTFNLCHWLRVDGEKLEERLALAAPYLMMATINGADADGTDWDRLIQTLDKGTFDVNRVLRALDAVGYTGPIGLQGFGIGGDVHDNLRRSMGAWRTLTPGESAMDRAGE